MFFYLTFHDLTMLTNLFQIFPKSVQYYLSIESDLKNGHIEALKLILEREPKGNCPIYIEYCIEKAKALLKFDEMWDLQVSKGTINKIKEKIPKLEVEVLY